MMRTFFLALMLPAGALAQLQLFQYDGATEKAVGQTYDAGAAPSGDSIETRFRVRNPGKASVSLTALSVAGAGFKLASQPSLPYVIPASGFVDFSVLFSAASQGSYSATLQVNTINVVLRATATPAAILSLGQTALSPGATIDFGKAFMGSVATQTLTLTNPSTAPLTVSSILVTGADFKGPLGVSAPLVLAPGKPVSFTVSFSPSSTQTTTGTLTIDQRSYKLTGQGTLPTLQLFQFDGTTEKPVGQLYEIGSAAPGDNIETRFRVRNTGTAPVNLTSLSVAGTSFRLSSQPSLPYVIAPSAFVDFRVLFSPTDPGSYSANLLVNTISVTLRGTAVAGAVLMLGQTVLGAGATIDFGQTEPGTSLPISLTLANRSSTSVPVSSITVTGADFSGPTGISTPLALSPGQAASFTIKFSPSGAHSSQGVLTVDQRSFNLTGLGVNPPLPKASIQFDSPTGISGRQAKVSVQLATTSRVAGTGTLTMEFRPSVQGVTDDPAIRFLSGQRFNATVTIGAGESIGRFGGSADFAFQTGTTAGSILFTLKLPNDTVQATFAIPAAAVSFDTTTGTRRVNDLDVNLIGFDNTHSAGQMTFTFYDQSGKVLQPGTIRVDETADFRRYFGSSTALGGSFQLRATFPVTGDAAQVAGVEVEITNPAGVTKTQRITF